MSNLSSQCGGGGWTLVMKLDPEKDTFRYKSLFWKNNATLNVNAGLDGLTKNETKLASYHNTPFTEICLGMTDVINNTNWILLNHTASSLYSVIADGNYAATNAGRAKWMSLMDGSSLQPNCNKEGFNIKHQKLDMRIGFAANNEDNCASCDSFIGFGINRHNKWKIYSGTIKSLANITLKAFGYILVR
ncbi:Hypothetical predicted protein [Paramuricea clavata]|uniref:Uncharacterized protein n=1 Tax=Paramuricea clavata TaxID=317549 RepID=A0A6S7HMB7_PARCT|nr:Hypothetical predicted protein [Paramuricea clavata]